jgi:hypothetical protein
MGLSAEGPSGRQCPFTSSYILSKDFFTVETIYLVQNSLLVQQPFPWSQYVCGMFWFCQARPWCDFHQWWDMW